MSSTKAVHVFDTVAWFRAPAHDVVLATMIEVAEESGLLDPGYIDSLRPWASFDTMAFWYPQGAEDPLEAFVEVVGRTRERIAEQGEPFVVRLNDWSVLDGYPVSGGGIGPLESGGVALDGAALLDAVDGLVEMLEERLVV